MPAMTLRSTVCLAGLACAALSGPAGSALAETPRFKFSELPPPATEPAPSPSLYDVLATGDVSPMGTPASSVKPSELFEKAASLLPSADGQQPGHPAEAEFWLKRAMLAAPDETGNRRAWAAAMLGLLLYQGGDAAGRAAARDLWEVAGAWRSATALCNLGELSELGDSEVQPDPKQALVWYERAKKAGCAQADAALARLRH